MKGIVSWAVPYNINPMCNKKKVGDFWIKNRRENKKSRLKNIFSRRDFSEPSVDIPN